MASVSKKTKHNYCDCQGDQNCMPGYYCETGNCSEKNSLIGVCVEDLTGLSGLKETWYGSILGNRTPGGGHGLLCPNASPPRSPQLGPLPCDGIVDCCPGIERSCACACDIPMVCANAPQYLECTHSGTGEGGCITNFNQNYGPCVPASEVYPGIQGDCVSIVPGPDEDDTIVCPEGQYLCTHAGVTACLPDGAPCHHHGCMDSSGYLPGECCYNPANQWGDLNNAGDPGPEYPHCEDVEGLPECNADIIGQYSCVDEATETENLPCVVCNYNPWETNEHELCREVGISNDGNYCDCYTPVCHTDQCGVIDGSCDGDDDTCDDTGVCNGDCYDNNGIEAYRDMCGDCYGLCDPDNGLTDGCFQCSDGSYECHWSDCKCEFKFKNPLTDQVVTTDDLYNHPGLIEFGEWNTLNLQGENHHGILDCDGNCMLMHYETLLHLWKASCEFVPSNEDGLCEKKEWYFKYVSSWNDCIYCSEYGQQYHGVYDELDCMAPPWDDQCKCWGWHRSCGPSGGFDENCQPLTPCSQKYCCGEDWKYFFDNNTSGGLTFWDRAHDPNNNNMLEDGTCHTGYPKTNEGMLFNAINNDGTEGWGRKTSNIPTYQGIPSAERWGINGEDLCPYLDDSGHWNKCYVIPNFNCPDFWWDKKFSGWPYELGDCYQHNFSRADIDEPDDPFRDNFLFDIRYEQPLFYLTPYKPHGYDFVPFETEEKAIRPIRIKTPLTHPTDCGCGFANHIWGHNFSDAIIDTMDNFCKQNSFPIGLACRIVNAAIMFEQTKESWQRSFELDATGHISPGGSHWNGRTVVRGVYNALIGDVVGTGMGVLGGITGFAFDGRNEQRIMDRISDEVGTDIMGVMRAIEDIANELVLTAGRQRRIPLHPSNKDYEEMIHSQNNHPLAPYQIKNWSIETSSHCDEDDMWWQDSLSGGGGVSLADECLFGDDNIFDWWSDIMNQPWEEWFSDVQDKRDIYIDGDVHWYHESTPYRLGKIAVGTSDIDYRGHYDKLGPYNTSETTGGDIENVSDLNHVDLTSVSISSRQSDLGIIEMGTRLKALEYPYNHAFVKQNMEFWGEMETLVEDINFWPGWMDAGGVGWWDETMAELFTVGVYGGGEDQHDGEWWFNWPDGNVISHIDFNIGDGVGTLDQCAEKNPNSKVC